MAVKAKQQYYADNTTLKKEAREFGMIDELKEKLDSVEWGAQVNVIEEVQENGVPLEIVDKSVNVLVPEVIDNLYTIDPNNSLSAKQGKILYDMIKNLLSRGRFLSTWNTATGLPLTNPEESPYPYKAGDYYIVGVTAQEGGTNFRPEPGEYVINVASDEQETSEVHVSDIYVYDGEKWILLINSTRELAVDDYVDYTYQSTNPVENQAIARELVKKQNIFHYIGNTAPTPQNEGDEWYDTANDKLKVWDGEQWHEVGNGDTYTAGLHISIDPNDNNKISVVEWAATSSALGLVKLGSDTPQTVAPNNVSSKSNRTYRIQANNSGQLMVNVPWEDTTYISGTGISISNNRVISCTVKPVTVGPTAPSTPGTGDLWYDTNKNTMFLYKNNAWTIIGPEIYPITKADYDALTPAEQGDGRFFLITDNDGTIYVDWENVQNRPMYIGTTSPTNPCEGYLWYDTTNDVLKVYDGTQWNEVGGGGGCCYTAGNGIDISNDEISIDTTVVATKTDLNSKQDAFHTTSSTAPSNPSEGDEWYDTTNDVLKVYDGTNWIVTGKTYTAGDGIDIDANNEISVDVTDIIGTGLSEDANNNIIVDTTVVATQTDLASKQDKATSGSGAPSTTPTYVGQVYIDTTNDNMYVATGTSSSSDWTAVDTNTTYTAGDGINISASNVISTNGETIYVGSIAPSHNDYHLWYDTVDETIKHYIGSGWEPIGLGTIYYGPINPSGSDYQFWLDTSTQTLMYYDGEYWETLMPYGGKTIRVGEQAPSSANLNDLWLNSRTNKLYRYNTGSNVWVEMPLIFVGSTAPSNPEENQFWFSTTDGKLRVYYGSVWTVIGGATYTAGNGIYIDGNNGISVDTADLAGTGLQSTTATLGVDYETVASALAGDGLAASSGEIYVDINTLAGTGLESDGSSAIDVDFDTVAGTLAGTGLTDNNGEIDIDSTIVALKTDLSNYYTKSETYTKTEVDNLVANVGSFEVVSTLPSVDTANTKKIYLLGPIGTGADKYEEYIVTESTTTVWNPETNANEEVTTKSWTKIGETSIDLSNYVTSTELATTLEDYATTTDLATKADDSGVVHLAGAETITGVKTFTANSGTMDGAPAVITPRIRINGQTGNNKFKSQLDIWKGNTKKGYLGYFEMDGLNRFEFASEETSTPFYIGLQPWKQNNLSIALTNQGIRRGGTSDTFSADKAFAVIGDLDKRIISSSTSPSNPTEGQLWYDTTNDVLKTYDGTNWNATGKTYTASDGIDINANNEISVDVTDIIGTGLSEDANNNIIIDTYTVASDLAGIGLVNLGGKLSVDTRVIATEDDLSGKQDKATSGSTAPSTTPTYVGQQYIDTTADKMYVATGTSSSSDWTEVGAGSGVTVGTTAPSNPSAGDLWYDTTSTVLALKVYNGTAWQMVGPEVVPITQAAYDALSTDEKNNGKFYLITNASGTISVDWANITNKPSLQSKTTVGNAAPSTAPTEVGTFYLDSTNDKLYVAVGTTASTDWLEVGSNSGGGNVIAMTQAEYNALTTEEKNDGKLRIITDAPTEDISVDWTNVANKPIDISTQTGTLSSVKIWVGSQTDYEALATKDSNTLYFTTNVVSGS